MSVGDLCVVCDSERIVSFTDLHGQADCVRCGTPYLLAGYNDRTETVCSLKDEALPLVRAYWTETRRSNGLGTYLSDEQYSAGEDLAADRRAFTAWCDAHPELVPS